MKKILFTVHQFYPEVGGSGEVVYRLAKKFVRDGFDVFVATTFNEKRKSEIYESINIKQFKIKGNKVKGYKATQSEIERYKEFLLNNKFDAIINYAAQSWCTDIFLDVIEEYNGKKIIVPCGFSGLFDPRYIKYFKELPNKLCHYDKLVYLSGTYQDIKYHRKNKLKNDVIIPNGADEEEFVNSSEQKIIQKICHGNKKKYNAICVSNFYFLKGQDFVIKAFNKLKDFDINLILVGQHASNVYYKYIRLLAWKNDNIYFEGNFSRVDTINLFKEADFFLFGSRIECSPLVMFESFASKTLFITKNVGNTYEYSQYNNVIKSPTEMAEAVKYYIINKDKYDEKVNSAYNRYLEQHTYEKIYRKYKKLVLE